MLLGTLIPLPDRIHKDSASVFSNNDVELERGPASEEYEEKWLLGHIYSMRALQLL